MPKVPDNQAITQVQVVGLEPIGLLRLIQELQGRGFRRISFLQMWEAYVNMFPLLPGAILPWKK